MEDFVAEQIGALGEDSGLFFEGIGVDGDAVEFHIGEDRDEWDFDVVIEFLEGGVLCQLGAEELSESEGDVGIFGGISGDLFEGALIHADLVFSFTDEVGGGDFLEMEEVESEAVDAVEDSAGVEEEGGDHGVEVDAAEVDAGVAHDEEVVLDVMADFFEVGVFEEGFEGGEGLLGVEEYGAGGSADGDVVAGGGLPGEAHADEVGVHGAEGIGFGIEGEGVLEFELLEEKGEGGGGIDEAVVAVIGGRWGRGGDLGVG